MEKICGKMYYLIFYMQKIKIKLMDCDLELNFAVYDYCVIYQQNCIKSRLKALVYILYIHLALLLLL